MPSASARARLLRADARPAASAKPATFGLALARGGRGGGLVRRLRDPCRVPSRGSAPDGVHHPAGRQPAPVQAPPRPQAQTQSNQPRSPGNARLPEETAAVRKPEMQIAQGARPGVVDNALDDVPAINRPQPAPGKEPNRKPGVSEAGVAQPQGFKAKP